jgi:hypothetical protein
MDDQYWITISDEQLGPYTIGQLRSMWHSGTITAETLYWQQGFENWYQLRHIINLLEGQQTATPPPVPQVGYVAPQQPQQQPQQQTSGCTWIIIIALGIFIGLLLISFF